MKFWFLLRGINWKYYTIIVWYQSVGCRPITLTPKCTILFYNSALQLPTFLEIIHSIITLHPDSVTKIASACLHNFLCARRSEAYMTPALADWEDVDHRVNEGAWGEMVRGPCNVCQRKGHGTLLLLLNSNVTFWKITSCHLLARCHGKKSIFSKWTKKSVC